MKFAYPLTSRVVVKQGGKNVVVWRGQAIDLLRSRKATLPEPQLDPGPYPQDPDEFLPVHVDEDRTQPRILKKGAAASPAPAAASVSRASGKTKEAGAAG
jgi:hypothetical protein